MRPAISCRVAAEVNFCPPSSLASITNGRSLSTLISQSNLGLLCFCILRWDGQTKSTAASIAAMRFEESFEPHFVEIGVPEADPIFAMERWIGEQKGVGCSVVNALTIDDDHFPLCDDAGPVAEGLDDIMISACGRGVREHHPGVVVIFLETSTHETFLGAVRSACSLKILHE
jgi:hypothetical protein